MAGFLREGSGERGVGPKWSSQLNKLIYHTLYFDSELYIVRWGTNCNELWSTNKLGALLKAELGSGNNF